MKTPPMPSGPAHERPSSRIPGFYRLSRIERARKVCELVGLGEEEAQLLASASALGPQRAERMIENATGVYGLPLGFAPNFRIDGRDFVVPMVIEEPSVVAASANAARLLREGAGIETSATPPVMIAQVQLLDVGDLDRAARAIEAERDRIVSMANDARPSLVRRGGGARDLCCRKLPDTPAGPMLVVHLLVDVRDAMGANIVNGMAEAIAPHLARLAGARPCLRILSNLASERRVQVRGQVPLERLARDDLGLSGADVARGVFEASALAEVDPWRAATHNKGIMNGIDAVLVATGQDWRAAEAGAHAWAAHSGHYTALARWRVHDGVLVGEMELPMQVGTVGGVLGVHPLAGVLLRVLGVERAEQLARIAAAVGLAQNLAALLALATEGIQRGHMELHARNIAAAVGVPLEDQDWFTAEIVRRGALSHDAARALWEELRPG